MSEQWRNEFPWPETGEWVELIKKSAKDPKDLEKLIWSTDEGFDLNAFYRADDIKDIAHDLAAADNLWEIRQIIYSDKIMAANQSALKALENGADSIYFIGKQIGSENELLALFKDIRMDWIQSHYDFGESNVAWLYMMIDYYSEQGYALNQMKGSINYDPLAELLLNGKFSYSPEETWKVFASVLETTHSTLPQYKTINVNARHIRESGGNVVQELATALSMAVEYIDQGEQENIKPEVTWQHLQFHLTTGANYFLEIGKIRAFKLLIRRIAKAYKIEADQPTLNITSTAYNKTVYDAPNNLIRATMEAMGATIGGANAITIHPYDEYYKQPEEFGYRLSRGLQLILKEEARLDKVSDPSAGSYYVETITEKVAEAAWNLFLEMEKQGGFVESLKKKFIQPKVQLNAEKQSRLVNEGDIVSVGTNKYIQKTETKIGEYTIIQSPDISGDNKLILPLKPQRLTEKIEIERMKMESQTTKELN